MAWSELHSRLLADAFSEVLGRAEQGSVAFVRCLEPDVMTTLARDGEFAVPGWTHWRVGDAEDVATRSITADRAVELREAKADAVLLLVDTTQAGAGMDGIYSAAQEVGETQFFEKALAFAKREVTKCFSKTTRAYAERAVKKARGFGRRFSVSPWTEFDFFTRSAAEGRHPGELLHLLGLWPVSAQETEDPGSLDLSRVFVERLLGTAASGQTPAQRIEALKLLEPGGDQIVSLQDFLRSAGTKPLVPALAGLATLPHLWINALRVESAAQAIQGIDLEPWRNRNGRVAKWSGLVEAADADSPPLLVLAPDAHETGQYSKLDVQWKARPEQLAKGAVEYRVAIVTDMEEELASREVSHSGRVKEKCRFSNDDFSMLNEDALIGAKVAVSVIGNDQVEARESEEFTIQFGHVPDRESPGVGKKLRAFSEGLLELGDREAVTSLVSSTERLNRDAKGFVLLRTGYRGKSFRVPYPPLIRDIEEQWHRQSGAIARWRVRVRASGARASAPECLPLTLADSSSGPLRNGIWERVSSASRRLAERFALCGGVGQVYDDHSKGFDTIVREYILAWAALLEDGNAGLALANTVEVQTLSGRTVGLIVLPSHPLRVAWHVAYDNLVFHAAFEEAAAPRQIREELLVLDGAMFPAFLPGLEPGSSFVFADTLGFHTTGMVPDSDREPKAAVAILARSLSEKEVLDTVPTVGKQSAEVLGNELLKYIECHETSKFLHLHALRPGDGFTVARALGRVYQESHQTVPEEESEGSDDEVWPAFKLELYPSHGQRLAGRFIAEVREKRRAGAGVVSADDRWMLESISLPGGIGVPRLQWARKGEQEPRTPAHVAVAFDTFESRVVDDARPAGPRPLSAFGLLSYFDRTYTSTPSPLWRSVVAASGEGEKHPSDRSHTERLVRLQQLVSRCVGRHLAASSATPMLRTEISAEKAHNLRELHRLCDWVITLDRNAGIEYFDSPRDNKEIYDAYVIDCVPEREDLGCLQLITSTSNLEEVRNLLDSALDQMGLSRSRRNAEFLMQHLKAVSGRLAIRLTGQRAPTSELIALALCHASCRMARQEDRCWAPLNAGFLIPVDDVLDLIPPLMPLKEDGEPGEAGQVVGKARPDLIYVSVRPRKGLSFQFIEVKYRRHLRAARSPDVLEAIRRQVESWRHRWDDWFGGENAGPTLQAVRRAKLARVLRFYADKAKRHFLPDERHDAIVAEIDRMLEKGHDYSLASIGTRDRGWVFCPEFLGGSPLAVAPGEWETEVYLFGPNLLPDSGFREPEIHDTPPGAGREGTATSEEVTSAGPGRVGSDSSDSWPAAMGSEAAVSVSHPDDRVPPTSSQDGHSPESSSPAEDVPHVLLGQDVLTGADVRWDLTVKGNPHLLVAGLPGMGKTTCLLNLCRQMLQFGVRPIVFSYHQDIDERLRQIVGAVRFLDFHGLGFNPLQVFDREARMAYLDVCGALRDIFLAIFPELGDIQGERIRKAIKESFLELGWADADARVSELSEPPFARFLEILRGDPRPDRGLKTLLARLEELDDYGFFSMAESYESLWESDQPIVIRIHATQNDNLQKAFASLVFYGLYKDMFRRGVRGRITHAVVFDEAHRAARLRLIPTMAKECRKYGISLVLASQEAKDFNISLFSAIANYLVLRLNETDAKALVRNVASSDQERSLVDKIKQIERFRAFYFSEGRRRPAPVALLP